MIEVLLYDNPKQNPIGIQDIVESVTWTGDENTFSRKCELTIKNSSDSRKKLVPFEVGKLIIFKAENKTRFKGTIFQISTTKEGTTSIVAYDQLVYLAKNSTALLVKNRTAANVIKQLLGDNGFKVGNIADTKHKIKKEVFGGNTLDDIFKTLLEQTEKTTGEKYRLYLENEVVHLTERSKLEVNTVSIDNIENGDYSISIEDTKTKVMVTRGNIDPDVGKNEAEKLEKKPTVLASSTSISSDFKTQEAKTREDILSEIEANEYSDYDKKKSKDAKDKKKTGKKKTEKKPYKYIIVTDEDSAKEYGTMQHVESVDDKTSDAEMQKIAETLLKELSEPVETFSIEFMGFVQCTTGKRIGVYNENLNMNNFFYISADSHTFSQGVHKMNLQLSKKWWNPSNYS